MENKNIDILSDLNLEDINLNKQINIENKIQQEEKIYETINFIYKVKRKKKNNILYSFIFLFKYITTSSLIFGVLLVSSNYSAYINIAKSYIFADELSKNSQRLISSVEASNIKDNYSEKIKDKRLEKKEVEKKEEKLSIKKMQKLQDKEDINLNIEITPYENRVVIPKIWKNVPLLDIKNRNISWEKELNNIFMDELENGIIRYPGSAKPWEHWTSFIFGHSSNFPWIDWDYNDVFALLDNVEYNDEVIVYYGQKKYTYKIREKKVITPWDVSVLERNKNKSEITLMTCRPIWTTLNRLIVTWELVEKK